MKARTWSWQPSPTTFSDRDLTLATVQDFLRQFGRFLREDARHDFWIRSHDDDATIVLDRHNLIYAYGPLNEFETALRAQGARNGEPVIPNPHIHNYHQAWDDAEEEVLRHLEWRITPLRPMDMQ